MLERIKAIIKELRLSQNKFAEKVGLSSAAMSAILNGKRNLADGTIARIVARTGVSERWLRDGEGEMFATNVAPSPFEYAQAQGCNETISRLFARYCALPQDGKAAFEKIVDSLLAEKTGDDSD